MARGYPLASDCQKTFWEVRRAAALRRVFRIQRHVRWIRKPCAARFPCTFPRPRRRRRGNVFWRKRPPQADFFDKMKPRLLPGLHPVKKPFERFGGPQPSQRHPEPSDMHVGFGTLHVSPTAPQGKRVLVERIAAGQLLRAENFLPCFFQFGSKLLQGPLGESDARNIQKPQPMWMSRIRKFNAANQSRL